MLIIIAIVIFLVIYLLNKKNAENFGACQKNVENTVEAEEDEATNANAKQTTDKRRDYAFWLSAATSPVLFVIRMLTQTTEHVDNDPSAWRSYDQTVVPGNIQAIMLLLLALSVGMTIYFRKTSHSTDRSRDTLTTVLTIANVLVGIILTFGAF